VFLNFEVHYTHTVCVHVKPVGCRSMYRIYASQTSLYSERGIKCGQMFIIL